MIVHTYNNFPQVTHPQWVIRSHQTCTANWCGNWRSILIVIRESTIYVDSMSSTVNTLDCNRRSQLRMCWTISDPIHNRWRAIPKASLLILQKIGIFIKQPLTKIKSRIYNNYILNVWENQIECDSENWTNLISSKTKNNYSQCLSEGIRLVRFSIFFF